MQYQLKHFELTGDAQAKQFDQPQAVELLGLAPGELGDRRRSRTGAGPGEGLEGDDGRRLSTSTGKGAKDRRTSRLGTVTFLKAVSDITVFEDKTAAFECAVSDAEAPITWLINDQPVPSERIQILSVGKTRRLVLQKCALNQDGFKITAIIDEITKSSGQLFVKEALFEFVEPLKHLKAKQGSPCELQCTVNKLNVALQWFKDEQPITDLKEVVDGYLHKLIIPIVQEKDKGLYVAKYEDVQTEGQVDVLGMSLSLLNCSFLLYSNRTCHSADEQETKAPSTGKFNTFVLDRFESNRIDISPSHLLYHCYSYLSTRLICP